MRILDEDSDKKLDNVTIFLTKDESLQLLGYLKQLLNDSKSQHHHLSSGDYQKEITVCLYDETNLEGFHPRAIQLIKEDR